MTKFEAWISTVWRDQGIFNVVVSRTGSDGHTDTGFFLVDSWCLGVKDAFLIEDTTPMEFQDILDEQLPGNARERIHPSCAKHLIDGAIAYADSLGFLPCGDFKKARKALSGLDASLCDQEFVYGKDGKPCFVAGPDDSAARIDKVLHVLNAKLGSTGFNAIVPDPKESPVDEIAPGFAPDGDEDLFEDDDETHQSVGDIYAIREELKVFIGKGPKSWPSFEHFLGMMTAMQVSPKIVQPEKLLEFLPGWGVSLFNSLEEAVLFIRNFEHYWNSLADLIALEADSGPSADSPIDLYEDEYKTPKAMHQAHIDWAKGFCETVRLFPAAWGDALLLPELAKAWAIIRAWAAKPVDDPNSMPSARSDHVKLDKAIFELYRALRQNE